MRWISATIKAFLNHPAAAASLIVLGLGLRCVALGYLSRTPLFADARSYHTMALHLAHGEPFSPYWPPGLPYYLSLFARLISETETIARGSMLLLYAVFSLLLYRCVRLLASRPAANIALAIFALYPACVHFSVEPLTELPAATCLLATTYLTYVGSKQRSWLHLGLLGLILGWFALVRPSSMALIPLVLLYLLVRTKRVGLSMAPCLMAALIISSWLYKAHNMAGYFVMVNRANVQNLFFGNNPYTPLYRTWWLGSHAPGEPGVPAGYSALRQQIDDHPEKEQDRLYRKAATDHMLARPDLFLLRTINRTRNYFAFDTYTGSVLLKGYRVGTARGMAVMILDALFFVAVMFFSVLFLFAGRNARQEKHVANLILAAALFYALPYWFSFSHPRFHFPVVPLFGLFAAALLGRLSDQGLPPLFAPLRKSMAMRYGLLGTLAILAYIQIEWVFILYSWPR